MSNPSCRRQRRSPLAPLLVAAMALVVVLLVPVLESAAQGSQIQRNPTPTPTEEFDPNFVAQATEEPTREPQRTSPTEEPTQEPIDDVVANPTDEPEPASPSSLTLNKGACDDSNFDPYTATGLQAFLDACFSPDGEFEFTVANDVAFNTTQSTELGSLFMQVPTGPITITETIPDGWGDPAVFCWSNLFPTPAEAPFIGNSPMWDIAEGEDVECWWFNVSEPAGHTIRVEKRVCAEGYAVPDDYWTLANACQEHVEGVGFALTTDGGTVEGATDASGMIEWTGVDLGASGQVQLDEDIPDGYGEPVTWCVNFPVEAADAQDFDFFQVESGDGLIAAIPEQDAPFIFHCTYFNVLADGGAPGNLTDPAAQEGGEEVEHRITLTKHTCPAGTDPDAGIAALLGACAVTPGVEFTLEFGGGATSTTETDASGVVSWDGIPYGEFEILETNHADYALQSAHCQFEDLPGPGTWIYDFNDGVYDGSFDLGLDPEDGSIHLVCDWFNFEDGEGVDVTVVKHRCPLGVPEDTTIDQYIVICPALFEGIDFTLEHDGGVFPGTTGEDGQVVWPGVPAGEIEIQETIPEGYKDPLAFCISFDGEQELESGQVTATGGIVPLTIPEEATAVVCYLFNIQDPDQATSLTVNKWRCPPGFDKDVQDPETHCTEPMDGVTFTLGDMEATTGEGVPGQAVFLNVPTGETGLAEVLPEGIAHAFVGGCTINGEAVPLLVPLDEPPAIEIHIDEGAHWVCDWYNVPEDHNAVSIRKLECADGTSPDEEQDWYEANCTESMDGVEFTIASGAGEEVGETSGGVVDFDGLPAGGVGIQETIPDGFGNPVVYCRTDGDWFPYFAPGGLFSHDFADTGITLFCHVFNIPGEIGDTELIIYKWVCPAGYDETAPGADPLEDCTERADGVTFTVTDDNPETAGVDVVSGDFGPGKAHLDGLSPGEHAVTETLPEGFVRGFNSGTNIFADADPLTYDFTAGENQQWHIHFFNVLDGSFDLTLLKWTCPPGYDLYANGADPKADCTEATNGVDFQFGQPGLGEAAQLQTTGDVIEGGVVFEGDLPGTYQVVELVPAGVASTFVLDCPGYGEGQLQLYPFSLGNELVLDITGGESITCNWYNVAAAGSRVVIEKHICPADVDLVLTDENSIDDFIDACPTEGNGIEFTLDHAGGSSTYEIHFGQTWWDGVPNGPITITETIPPGYLEPVWYCDSNVFDEHGDLVVDFQWEQYDAPAGVVAESLDEEFGEIFACKVFNVIDPDEENGILIYKWRCPEGTSLEESLDWYEDTCTEEHDGVDFKVASDLGLTVVETSGGQVQFDGLPAGTAGIQEYIPEGFGAPIVFCAPHGSPWQQIDAPTGYWEYDFPSDGVVEALVCYVFNIPGEPPDLTILKWTCPVGYDLYAAGADPYADCTEATNGIEFELRFEGDATLQQTQTTGDVIDGGVIFDDLEPDVYNVAELVPDGIASVFVLECTGHIMGMLQPYPLQFGPFLDDIDLDAGEHLVCHWYNVPDDEGGDLTLIKYTCTTEEFVSEIDCQIEEDGKTFDFSYWTGTWDLVGTETTDGFGRIHWTGLEPGEYWFDEHDGEWCHIASDQLYEDGPWVVVPADQETVVHVYNCDGTPGDPGDTPEKYPNTGTPPETATPSAPTGPEQAVVTRVGFLDAFGTGFDLFGPFAGVVGLMVMIWRTIDTRNRIARDRERTEERQWYEEATARDRPDWMAGAAPSRTARPAWMTQQVEDPLSRPDWMKRKPIFPDAQRRE